MAQDFVGVIVGAQSGEVKAVINPNDDRELDNPRWLLLKGGEHEAMRLIRVPRGDYQSALSMSDVANLVERFRQS